MNSRPVVVTLKSTAAIGRRVDRRPKWRAGRRSATKPLTSPHRVGGKGKSDCDQAANHGNMVALCDIDDNPLNARAEKFPTAKVQ